MKVLISALLGLLLLASCQSNKIIKRVENFNDDWKFILNNVVDPYQMGFDDNSWRGLDLPHDWSVEFPFDSVNGEGCTGYLPGGLGWYRKSFSLKLDAGQKAFILFDGVYNNSTVWLNGIKLGEHPYGYSPFYFDLTPFVNNVSGENVITVKVDRTRFADSRWYSGSGIYRNVQLIRTNKLHIPVWGTFITTPKVRKERAEINLEITLNNEFDIKQDFKVITDIKDGTGKIVKQIVSEESMDFGQIVLNQKGEIDHPKLWNINNPKLYTAVTKIIRNGEIIDQVKTRFGIRSFNFNPKEGFTLNGENMKIKGVCLHHDGGLVGAAVPKGVWKRRLQTLKDGGCNAIRISHNPASNEFLDLCDEMGFLVQDEFFDEWDYPKDKRQNMWEQHDDYISRGYSMNFQECAEKDLKNSLMSHRNHPSIFQWSIGNEIEWTYPRNRKATGYFNNINWNGNYFWSQPPYSPEKIESEYNKLPALTYQIGKTAQKLANWTKELDTTRPVIANCILPSVSYETGYADALDIVGFSYRRVMYDYAREHYPNKVVMGTENLPQWHEWKAVVERPFVAGVFLWTGIDYLGEANNQWPKKGTSSGLLDLAGFEKPAFFMYKSLWTDAASLSIYTQLASKTKYKNDNGHVVEKQEGSWEKALWEWPHLNEHWNYNEGEEIIVEVISNCSAIELFLNDQSLGVKQLIEFPDRIYKWAVPFTKGEIKAVAHVDTCKLEKVIKTSSEPVSIQLTVDQTSLMANSDQVAHVFAQLMDVDGNPVLVSNVEIEFQVQGDIKLLGVDNGDIRNIQPYQSNFIKTHNGKALLIVQENNTKTKVEILCNGEKIKSNRISLKVR